jgi:GDP-mannose transporter
MTFLLLFIQSSVCVLLVVICKKLRLIQYGDFNTEHAKKWFPISTSLVLVIYTGAKSLVRTARAVVRVYWLPERSLTFDLIAISQYTGVHHLQEPHHHPNCV